MLATRYNSFSPELMLAPYQVRASLLLETVSPELPAAPRNATSAGHSAPSQCPMTCSQARPQAQPDPSAIVLHKLHWHACLLLIACRIVTVSMSIRDPVQQGLPAATTAYMTPCQASEVQSRHLQVTHALSALSLQLLLEPMPAGADLATLRLWSRLQ